jgi:hypothetical protein
MTQELRTERPEHLEAAKQEAGDGALGIPVRGGSLALEETELAAEKAYSKLWRMDIVQRYAAGGQDFARFHKWQ